MEQLTTALLRLAQLPRLGATSIQRLLKHVSIEDLLYYDAPTLKRIGWTEGQIKRWFQPHQHHIDSALRWAEKHNHHIVHCFDPAYPHLLAQIDAAPPLLFVAGELALLSEPQLAIVGSRQCSNYGEYWAKHFAVELTLAGLIVTSGLALGIDGFCHQAVVEIQGKTIAVLGSGLAQIYPRQHKGLAQAILEQGGALVSEFLPEHPPIAENFPRRNRIISGLTLGTLVIEASERSGSLITARYALEQNREVFALPSNIQNEASRGCHQLIKQGAMLVETVQDIVENLPPYHVMPMSLQSCSTADSPQFPHISSPAHLPAPVYPTVFAKISYQPISIDLLSQQLALPIDTLLVQLLELELQGLIMLEDGGYKRT
ncbi:DNA-processing protein DprA [Pasteurella sp. P03HT]